MGEWLHQSIQSIGVIGTIIFIVIVGMIVYRKILDNWWLLGLVVLLLVLFMKNPNLLGDLSLPNDLGTIQSANTDATKNERAFEQCLQKSMEPELTDGTPYTNPPLQRAWQNCNVQYSRALTQCIHAASKDRLILDKNVYCEDKMLSSNWMPCAAGAIGANSREPGVVDACRQNHVLRTAGDLAGDATNQGTFKNVSGWIDRAWNKVQGWIGSWSK